MTSSGVANSSELPATRYSLFAAVFLSCAALAVVGWSLLQLDLPLARFLRSVHVPWLEFAGDLGYRLGSGAVLVGISAAMLAVGFVLKRPSFQQAGLEGLIAHGVAAAAVQALKHLIGRPRPRMTHGGAFLLGPSWDSGLDSFPSGHAGASFAVAAVLVKHFPRMGWVWYGAACWVAASRVLRGSHFPTDVFAGAGLGVLAGYVAANPMRDWRASLSRGLTEMVSYLVALFVLLWTAVHSYPDGWMNLVMVGLGVTMVGVGMGLRWHSAFSGQRSAFKVWVFPLLAVGLALTTGSALVTAVAGLVSIARWLAQPVHDPPIGSAPAARRNRVVFAEAALAVWLILVIVVIQGLKGLLPIL